MDEDSLIIWSVVIIIIGILGISYCGMTNQRMETCYKETKDIRCWGLK